MAFIGREKELNLLLDCFNSNSLRVILIKGRRRIGKSELIREAIHRFFKDKSIYFQATDSNLNFNLSFLSSVLRESLFHDSRGYVTLEDALEDVFRYSLKEKIVFVIDEYPYLRNSFNEKNYLDSLLQRLVDKYKNDSKLKLIIAGSSTRIMSSIGEKGNDLYGRVTDSITLTGMDYYEAAEFYPNYNNENKLLAYSVFGGSPFYASLVDDSKSVKENAINQILSKSIVLSSPIDILSQELKNLALANSIFQLISTGTHKFNDLLTKIGNVSVSSFNYTLKALEEMGIIRKITPINKEQDKRKTFYDLDDFFLRFYYRYLFRNLSSLSMMNYEQFYETFVLEDLEREYLPKAFEEITRQYFVRKNKEGSFNPPFINIGKYWYNDPLHKKNGEFDVVAKNAKGRYLFMECKYAKAKLNESDLLYEIQQVKDLGFKDIDYGFCSRSGYAFSDDNKPNAMLLTLDDLYK